MARRPRPTLAQVDALEDRNRYLEGEVLRWQSIHGAGKEEGRRQAQQAWSYARRLEDTLSDHIDFHAGRRRVIGFPGCDWQEIEGTPTAVSPDPELNWFQRAWRRVHR